MRARTRRASMRARSRRGDIEAWPRRASIRARPRRASARACSCGGGIEVWTFQNLGGILVHPCLLRL